MEILLFPVLIGSGPIADSVLKESRSLRVGQIFIVGNERTEDRIIRELLDIYPGQLLDHAEIRKAEQRLIQSGLFAVDEENDIRPRISVLEDSPGVFRDVLIQVKENPEQPPMLPTIMVLFCLLGFATVAVVLLWQVRRNHGSSS